MTSPDLIEKYFTAKKTILEMVRDRNFNLGSEIKMLDPNYDLKSFKQQYVKDGELDFNLLGNDYFNSEGKLIYVEFATPTTSNTQGTGVIEEFLTRVYLRKSKVPGFMDVEQPKQKGRKKIQQDDR